jgi:hypothetical protein
MGHMRFKDEPFPLDIQVGEAFHLLSLFCGPSAPDTGLRSVIIETVVQIRALKTTAPLVV